MKIKCWICGADATTTRARDVENQSMMLKDVSPYSRCYCDKCAKEVDTKEKEERELYIKLKK